MNVTTIFKVVSTKINSKSNAACAEMIDQDSDDDAKEKKNQQQNVSKESYKFYRKRRYLFSKYDQGIKLDDESWYSVTPESIGEYLAERVITALGTSKLNILDAFSGCGGNIIQFAKRVTKVYGCEIDEIKIKYCQDNCEIYGIDNYKILYKDYLTATKADFDNSHIDAIFLSPPWGGTGYLKMDKYTFDFMIPNFNQTLTQSLSLSKNLILYIPRNTDISEICSVLSIYANKMNDMGRSQEVIFEIERLGHFSGTTSVLVVYTGDLANIHSPNIIQHIEDEYLNFPDKNSDNYQKYYKGKLNNI